MKLTSAHLLALGLFCGCGRACHGESPPGAEQKTALAEAAAPTVTQSAAPSVTASASVDSGPPPLITFRMISGSFVEADEDAGRYLPTASATFRVEIAGWSSADIVLPCFHWSPYTTVSSVKPKLVGLVLCDISAQTTFLAVVEASPGEYAVTTWAEEEETGSPSSTRRTTTLSDMKVIAKLKKNPKWSGRVVMIDLAGHEIEATSPP